MSHDTPDYFHCGCGKIFNNRQEYLKHCEAHKKNQVEKEERIKIEKVGKTARL